MANQNTRNAPGGKDGTRRQQVNARRVPPGAETLDYEERRTLQKRRRLLRILVVLLILAAVAGGLYYYMVRRQYRGVKILKTSEQEDIISTKYVEMDGKILKYSPEEVSMINADMDTLWNVTYSMQNPVADVRDTRAVIADRDGTSLKIFDKKGLTGSADTSYPIVKARISAKGLVAAILDSGDDTWINFYASDGSLIAENQTRIDDPGYPMDVCISNDGVIMMVTYQFVQGGKTTSYVAFYNFGDVGQNEDDRIVSGYTYEGIVIPQVQYLKGSTSTAIREDGITLYQGRQIPKESITVKADKEIVSTFVDEDTIGLVFKNEGAAKMYRMQVYNTSGKLKFTTDFDTAYTNIRLSRGYILLYNSSQICVINQKGEVRFLGTVDGSIKDFFRIGFNKYLLVLDNGINVIKLT